VHHLRLIWLLALVCRRTNVWSKEPMQPRALGLHVESPFPRAMRPKSVRPWRLLTAFSCRHSVLVAR